MWKAWQQDFVTQVWGPTEKVMALELAEMFEEQVRSPTAARGTEIRRQMDSLGLTMKGKIDMRLREGAAPAAAGSARAERPSPRAGAAARARYGNLTLVDGEASA